MRCPGRPGSIGSFDNQLASKAKRTAKRRQKEIDCFERNKSCDLPQTSTALCLMGSDSEDSKSDSDDSANMFIPNKMRKQEGQHCNFKLKQGKLGKGLLNC